jgi:hypothetical protein
MVGDREALPAGDRTLDSSQGKTFNLLLGIGDGISDGHPLPASSQGKNMNVLLGVGDGISGRLRSTPCGGDRESILGLKAKVGLKPTGFVIL